MENSRKKENKNIYGTRPAKSLVLLLITLLTLLSLSACGSSSDKNNIEGIANGQWADAMMLCQQDNEYHPVQIRIVSVDRDAATVDAAISAFNVSGEGSKIVENDSTNKSYAVAHYEIMFPEDFPQDYAFGITEVIPEFSIVSRTGENEIQVGETIFQGINTTYDISIRPKGYDFYAGSTFEGSFVFLMPNDFSDYLIKYETPEQEAPLYFEGDSVYPAED